MTLVKAGLLPHLVKDKQPKSAQELSAVSGMEELLIGKFDTLIPAFFDGFS